MNCCKHHRKQILFYSFTTFFRSQLTAAFQMAKQMKNFLPEYHQWCTLSIDRLDPKLSGSFENEHKKIGDNDLGTHLWLLKPIFYDIGGR